MSRKLLSVFIILIALSSMVMNIIEDNILGVALNALLAFFAALSLKFDRAEP